MNGFAYNARPPRHLRAYRPLVQQFGRSMGLWLHQAAQGLDDRPVQTHSEPVSCSRETTFAQDLHAVQDKAQLGATFTWLCERVAEDLQRQGYGGRTVGIKLRFSDFRCVTREMTVDALLQDSAGLPVTRVGQAHAGQALHAQVSDGQINVTVGSVG